MNTYLVTRMQRGEAACISECSDSSAVRRRRMQARIGEEEGRHSGRLVMRLGEKEAWYEACAEAEERRAWRGSSGGMHERGRHDDGHQRRQTTSLHTPIDSPTAVAHTRHTIAIRTLFHPPQPHTHPMHPMHTITIAAPCPCGGAERNREASAKQYKHVSQPTHIPPTTSPPMRLSALPTTNHPRCFDC